MGEAASVDQMRRFLDAVLAFAQTIGGPGLFLISYLDSSFLSFPQAVDVLVVAFTAQYPAWWWYYAGLATLGSLAGCLSIHALAARGGEAFLRRRFAAGHVDRGMRTIQRHGLVAVLIPSILPPPAPFKLFVLLAGAARVPRGRFAVAILLGRGFRFFLTGWLTLRYGHAAFEWMRTNGRLTAFALVGVVLVAAVAFMWWRRRSLPAVPVMAPEQAGQDAGL
jgi:membrane protein YqaA with SNARE-associated domain